MGDKLNNKNSPDKFPTKYSYVWNNPLNATDPSGEFVFTLMAMAGLAGAGVHWTVAALVFTIAGTLDAIIAGADLSDAFLTGIISGLSAGAFSYAGSTWFSKLANQFDAGLYAAKIAVHGTIGGITSVLQGGKFGHGFASAGFTAAATSFNNSDYIHKNSNGFSWRRVAIGTTIGGSASKLSGGKFANGAITGAFSQALNSESQEGPKDVEQEQSLVVRATIRKLLRVEFDGESVNAKLKLGRPFDVVIDDDGSAVITQGAIKIPIDNAQRLIGAGLKLSPLSVTATVSSNEDITFSGTVSLPGSFKLIGDFSIKFTKTINVRSSFIDNSGLLGRAAKQAVNRKANQDRAICQASGGTDC